MPAASTQPQTDEEKITAFIEARAIEQCPPAHASGADREMVVGMVKPKKRKEWSPEARAAPDQRMRARQAAGFLGRQKKAPVAEPAVSREPEGPSFEIRKASTTEAKPASRPESLPAIEPTRRIAVPRSPARRREHGQLRDEDWPDIKSRLAKGETKAAIAGDYKAELEDLGYFIASCQRREAKLPPGEAMASLRI